MRFGEWKLTNFRLKCHWAIGDKSAIVQMIACAEQAIYWNIYATLGLNELTHWATHICVSKLTSIGSDNGLSPGRCQATIWISAEILLIRTWGTNFSDIFNVIHIFSFRKMHLKMSFAKWRKICLGPNQLSARPEYIHESRMCSSLCL